MTCACHLHMSLKRTARNSFFAPETPCTMPTLGDRHFSNFAGNIVSNGSKHPPPSGALLLTSEAFSPANRWGRCTLLWSTICNHSSEALRFGADLGCAILV